MTQSTPVTAAPPWVPDDSTFGARLVLIRQHMKWTNVAQAARECGVPSDSWRNWEEGMEPRRLPTIAMAIATRTGCDYFWLVHGPSGAMLRQRSEATHWYVETILSPPEPTDREGRVVHRDGRRSLQNRRSGQPSRRVRIATPSARVSVN